jgi:ATP-binding cassette subfamily B protein
MTEAKLLLSLAARYRTPLACGAALMFGETGAALLMPWIAGKLAETFIRGRADGSFDREPLFLGILALFAIQSVLKFSNVCLLGATADRIVADLKIRVHDQLLALPLDFIQQRRQGEALALLTNDVHVVGGYLCGAALAVGPLFVNVGGALALMFVISPFLAMVAAILTPPLYLIVKVFGRRVRPLAQELQEEDAAAVAIAAENIGMLSAIKTFTRETHESQRYREQVQRIVRLSAAERRSRALAGPIVQLLAATAVVLTLWLAQEEVSRGTLTAPQLVSFLLYGQLMIRPMSGLADFYGQTQRTRGALTRLALVLAEAPEPPPHEGEQIAETAGDIEFRGLTFSYTGRAPALNRLDLQIAKGETVAIIGPNGSGKSTLAHLLMRLHEPSSGKILIDGLDISRVSLHSLRSRIGIVPQHVLLFDASVGRNIAYGRSEPSQREIEAAARAACAHDFIARLPRGYDTLIGDRGVRLSGGQQQRLALARALLKNPPILILDEATAMFDPEGEKEFLHACRDVLRQRTVLLITHRPASLTLADRVIYLEDGVLTSADQRGGDRTCLLEA